jgi:predicted membrane protein
MWNPHCAAVIFSTGFSTARPAPATVWQYQFGPFMVATIFLEGSALSPPRLVRR